MRCTQFIGLNDRARKLVDLGQETEYTIRGTKTYADGRVEDFQETQTRSIVQKERYSETYGMGEEEIPLYSYLFPPNKEDPSRPNFEILEEVQASPWSSGPCIFLALMRENGEWIQESLWTDEEMDEYL